MEEKVQRLSEGMDFLEEALGYGEPLEYTEINESIISESNGSSPSPYKILGRCSGNFQPIGEFSRNKRLYSENLWPTVLQNEELRSRLAHRAVFGCLGHADKLVDDRDEQECKVSHIVTKLEVRKDKNTGKPFLYGELEILDTPAGRILEAMYKGGADLYVSSRAAGKLFPVPGQDYSIIKPEQYVVHTFDIVCRPGFIKARPMFEASPSESAQVSESQINELNDKTIESDLDKRQDQMYDAQVNAKTNPKAAAEATKKYEHALDLAQKEAERHDEILDQDEKGNHKHYKNESAEIAELNNKINQLTKIIEKVVDDVYEADNEPTQSIEEQLGDLLLNPSITEEAFEDVVAILKESKPELVNTIMENSRKKFNNEHAEKSGLEIEYYRFGGNKPYKIVPKGTDYFAASHDSPRYRSLKQAQKHILDTYNKPKENASEALNSFVSLMADSNISEEAFEEILDMIKGDLK